MIKAGSLAALMVVSLWSCSQPVNRLQSLEAGRSAYFALVPKGTVTTFFNRMADSNMQFVATAAPVDDAFASAKLTAAPGERLVMVELHPGAPARLPGELERFGNFAVLSTSYDSDLHEVNGQPTLYGEELGLRERHVKGGYRHFPHPPARPSAPPPMANLAAATAVEIDRGFLVSHVRQLSGDLPVSIDGQQVTIAERRSDLGRAHARAWLREEYEKIGFTVTESPYQGSSFGTDANFVAEKVGRDPSRVLIVSSHLDSVGNAGADDNGAGTISALALAQALKDAPLKNTLRIVAFDEEELGLIGSAAYAQQLQDSGDMDHVIGVINMEMTGYNSRDDGAFHIIDCNENTSATLAEPFKRIAARDTDLRLNVVDACTSRSDHSSFWQFGRPAVVLSQNFFGGDPNPCYHRECDKVDIMNFDYMTRMTTLLARVTEELLTSR